MDPITLGIGLSILGGYSYLFGNKSDTNSNNLTEDEVKEKLHDATKIPVPPIDRWVQVESDGGIWLVSPIYIAPVSIGEAIQIAKNNEAQLPSPALVKAIWDASDLKIEPSPRGANSKPPSDFTMKTMNSDEANINQLAIIKSQIDEKNPDWNFKLLSGSHKDVAAKNGKIGLYGWYRLNGKPIQDFYTGHAMEWKDYSQGARLVKKIG